MLAKVILGVGRPPSRIFGITTPAPNRFCSLPGGHFAANPIAMSYNLPPANPMWRLLGLMFRVHPWHGVDIGPNAPEVVTAYVEIVPTDTVKYELDKDSGLLRVDRPQRYSNICPALYGLIPQTFCGDAVAACCEAATDREDIVGDGDPMDICILTEKDIPRGDILVEVIPIGGLRMLDRNEADDKIIAVLRGDAVYGAMTSIEELPEILVDRLRHYFLTYKNGPDNPVPVCEITHVYGREEAMEVISASRADYQAKFSGIDGLSRPAGPRGDETGKARARRTSRKIPKG
jgi:inorganic pyrophosphatase